MNKRARITIPRAYCSVCACVCVRVCVCVCVVVCMCVCGVYVYVYVHVRAFGRVGAFEWCVYISGACVCKDIGKK